MHAVVFDALGGTCELYAIGPREPVEDTAEWIRAMHRRLTRFEPASELSLLNARAGDWVKVSDDLHELLGQALAAYERSSGLVHAGILPSLVAAGYDRTWEEMDGRSPSAARPPAAPVPPLPDLLGLRAGEARLAHGAAIDLGGIAKGWIADRAAERMGDNALANCGGDLRAGGGGPAGDGWPVAFGGRTLLLDGMGAATSGTTKRRWGDGLHHLIDPRSGRPASTDLSEVSVLAPTALDAEVLAKTALLLGSAGAPAFLAGRATSWALH